MKKKIVTLLLITTMIFSGCGGNSNNTKETELSKQNETVEDEETESKTDAASVEERSLAGIEQYMLDGGYLTGERTLKAAEMVGAIDGFGYDCGIEIYEYDTSSDTYASVAAGEEIPLEGMDGYFVKFEAVNGEFALFVSDESNLQAVVDAFMAY